MRLHLSLPSREARRLREKLLPLITVEEESWDSGLDIVSEPSLYPGLRLVVWEGGLFPP